MDDFTDSICDAALFSTSDANNRYLKVPIAEENQEMTAFVCHWGVCLHPRMVNVLKSAPPTFHRAFDITLWIV